MIFIDAHVHWHADVSINALLAAAWSNATALAEAERATLQCCVLFLVDMAGQDSLSRLRTEHHDGWVSSATQDDSLACLMEGPANERVLLVAGRQVSTSERIEVLGIGTREITADGKTLAETVQELQRSDPIVVIPWAFGKWWGGRGKLIGEFLKSDSTGVFLGDNAMRPRGTAAPSLFAGSRKQILPGTDPLPLVGDYRRCCTFGMATSKKLDTTRPWSELRESMNDKREFRTIGKRLGLLAFVQKQVQLRTAGGSVS